MFHFGLIPLIVLISATLTSGHPYPCKFQDPSPTYRERGNVHTLSFTKQLPASRTSRHYCFVTTDKSDSFLQVKARAFGQANGRGVLKCFVIWMLSLDKGKFRSKGVYKHAKKFPVNILRIWLMYGSHLAGNERLNVFTWVRGQPKPMYG